MEEQQRKQRRRLDRVPYNEELWLSYMVSAKAKAIDISEGGLYLYTDLNLKLNSVIEVSLPFKGKKINLKAEVRHIQEGIGVGLMFLDVNDEKKAQITELVEEIKKKPPKFKEVKTKILFVEDNLMSRRIMKHKLLSEGFGVIEATNGIEAIKILNEERIDVILLDLQLEKMDGFKVLSIVKGSRMWKDTPVIVYSGQGTEEVINKAMEAGADDFLVKMITPPDKLAEAIRTVMKRYDELKKTPER